MDAFLKRGKVEKTKQPKKEISKKPTENPEYNVSIKTNLPKVGTGIVKTGCLKRKEESKIISIDCEENTEAMDVDEDDCKDKKCLQPWVEKYRPNKIDEISHQSEVVSALRKSVSTGKVPHLLLHGPPGTGKTSTILALAKELFGPENYRSRIYELNASDDRGIAMVREKIKKFAQKKISKINDSNYPCPPIQIIILDEADSMTGDAQAALRRTIEVYSSQTRFCIICNYISKIIEPLTSRCVKFRFTPISDEAQVKRLKYICEQEEILHEDEALNSLIDVTDGDLRKSIMMLQSAGRSYEGESLTKKDIYEVSGRVPAKVITNLWSQLSDKNCDQAKATEIAEDMICEGYDIMQLLYQLLKIVVKESTSVVNDYKKAKIAEICSSVEAKLIRGGSEELNVLYLFMNISQVLHSE